MTCIVIDECNWWVARTSDCGLWALYSYGTEPHLQKGLVNMRVACRFLPDGSSAAIPSHPFNSGFVRINVWVRHKHCSRAVSGRGGDRNTQSFKIQWSKIDSVQFFTVWPGLLELMGRKWMKYMRDGVEKTRGESLELWQRSQTSNFK